MKLKTIIIVTSFLLTIIFFLFLDSFKSATAQVCPGGLWWSDPTKWPANTITMTSATKNVLTPSPVYVSSGNVRATGDICTDLNGGKCLSTTGGGGVTTINAANVSSGQFGANTGGGNYYFIDNVGIGTTAPGAKLDIVSGGQRVQFLTGTNSNSYTLTIGVNDDGVNFSNNSTIRGFNFKNANGTLLTITSNGNVGIGMTNPTQKLDVAGYVKGNGLCIENDCRTSWPTGGGGGGISGSGSTNYVAKWTGSTALGNSIIYDNGTNVGIGTTNPEGRLHITGGALRLDSNSIIFKANNTGDISFLNADGTEKARIYAGTSAGENWLRIQTAGRDRLTIDSLGNVGIGTVNPSRGLPSVAGVVTLKLPVLDVDGTIRSTAPRLYITGFDGANIFWINSGPDEGGAPLTNPDGDNVIGWNNSPTFKGRQVYIMGTTYIGFRDQNWTKQDLYVTRNLYVEGSKNFQIDHPLDPINKYLIHSTLEGPEAAVFYRGEAELINGKAIVTLPNYFEALTRKENRTVLLTPKFEGDEPISLLAASEVKNGKFFVRALDDKNPSQKFYWEVKAVRADIPPIEVEINK